MKSAHNFSDAAIQTCLSMKVLFGMALRQTTGFVESVPQLMDPDWAVPQHRAGAEPQASSSLSQYR